MTVDKISTALVLISLAARSLSFVLPAIGSTVRVNTVKGLRYSPDHAAAADDADSNKRRLVEFDNLEPILESSERRQRQEEADRVRSQFVSFGDDLWDLRTMINELTSKLVHTMAQGLDESTIEDDLRRKLRKVEKKDAEFVYMLQLAEAHEAYQQGRPQDAEEHKALALEARSCVPHFNLGGLWYGEFKGQGVQLINVTYVGDTLIATKLTGDQNMPQGEVTFQADLHPLRLLDDPQGKNDKEDPHHLEPIVLGETAAAKWGTRQLPRYKGKGRTPDYSQWLNGQLIIVGESKFGFAWTDIREQTFFARPSDKDILKLMRKAYSPPSSKACFDRQVGYVERCMSQTEQFLEDQAEDVVSNESNDDGKYFE